MTEWLHFHFPLSCIGEGNGNSLQCSCLENLRDRGVWWAAFYGVAQSRTRLKWLSSSSSSILVFKNSSSSSLVVIVIWPYWHHCCDLCFQNLSLLVGFILASSGLKEPPSEPVRSVIFISLPRKFMQFLFFRTDYILAATFQWPLQLKVINFWNQEAQRFRSNVMWSP